MLGMSDKGRAKTRKMMQKDTLRRFLSSDEFETGSA